MSTNPHGILTPANSEEPDLLRNEAAKKAAEQERVANLAQRRKDATSEIERILKCPDNEPREALQVSSEAGDDEALKALRKIGCLILPKLLEYSDTPDDLKARKTAEEAFSSEFHSLYDVRGSDIMSQSLPRPHIKQTLQATSSMT